MRVPSLLIFITCPPGNYLLICIHQSNIYHLLQIRKVNKSIQLHTMVVQVFILDTQSKLLLLVTNEDDKTK